jgi:hypothetical protein
VDNRIDEIKQLLSACTEDERRVIFRYLRLQFSIHPLEAKLNTQAEVILEAIDRASDLTLRGIRGVIAEAAFKTHVIATLVGWQTESLQGDFPYDFLLRDTAGEVRIQVKMQRRKEQRPMMANEGNRELPGDMYVVETQKTRGGIDPQSGQETRPYRFGEFDIIAVSMHPSTNDWSTFVYTVANWLIPRDENGLLIQKFQPVARVPDVNWTDNLVDCVEWFRSGVKKQIWQRAE